MAISEFLSRATSPAASLTSSWAGLVASMVAIFAAATFCKYMYRIYLHPLANIPGPRLAACTSLWLAWHTFVGDECTVVFELHKRYGPVLRVAPNDVDISDGDAVDPIYVTRGGFQKSLSYSRFNIDGHPTIFSTQTMPARANRAKAVVPLFSTASIRTAHPVLCGVIDQFVSRLQQEASRPGNPPVNVLNYTRCLAIDAVSAYLFQQQYGAVREDTHRMSASPFVDAFVGVGAFFNLFPGWFGDLLLPLMERYLEDPQTAGAMEVIDKWTGDIVKGTTPRSGTYPSRLLERNVSPAQVQIELKDLCFAGTDSTGMNMAMIIWYLCKYPDKYEKLKQELRERTKAGEDIMTSPYLRGVVREGLRLSWANPIRLPRVVPEGGWTFRDHYFPAGTSVGVAAFQLHQDEEVFPNPHKFEPERWLNTTDRMLTHFFAFGKGTRACIAQNLGTTELTIATAKVAQADVLKGAVAVQDHVEILEWFNTRVKGEEILIQFASTSA